MAKPNQQPKRQSNITLIPTHAADMPVSEAAEDAVIGGILANPDQYYSVAKIITSDSMFFFIRNQAIWRSMTALINKSMPIDDLTLTEYLSKKEANIYATLEPFHFMLLVDTAPSSNVDAYADIVKEKYIRRQTISKADALKAAALDESIPTEAIGGLLEEGQSVYAELATDKIHHISESTEAHIDMVEHNMETKGRDIIRTGLHDLDNMVVGLQKRKHIVIGGLSHHGKTALLLEIAINAAEQNKNVAYMNVADGDDIDVLNRLATMISRVSSKKLMAGTLSKPEHDRYIDAMGYVDQLPIYIKSQKGMSPGEINRECKIMKDNSGRPIRPDIIINDYIQRMWVKSLNTDNKRMHMMVASQHLTKLADEKHFNCPVVTGAQINASYKGERPTGFDVQESKDIYQDCDLFILVYRHWMVNKSEAKESATELIVAKNKQVGGVGTVHCYFDTTSARLLNGELNKAHLGSTR
jgi:replicative DNA helicase